ncbi:MAG: hypothetical protein ACRCWQ_02105 [Bacilli bacterium]
MRYFNPDDAPEEVVEKETEGKHITARFRNEDDMKQFFKLIGAGNIDTRTKVVKYVPPSKRTSLDFLWS